MRVRIGLVAIGCKTLLWFVWWGDKGFWYWRFIDECILEFW